MAGKGIIIVYGQYSELDTNSLLHKQVIALLNTCSIVFGNENVDSINSNFCESIYTMDN